MQTILIKGRGAVNFLARSSFDHYPDGMASSATYILDEQIGFLLRRVTQRHLAIFSEAIPQVTTTQFAVLGRLAERGPQSQNQLGRATAMDAATIKGVVDRLEREGLLSTSADLEDRRRLTISLTEAGIALFETHLADALAISRKTLEPLTKAEQAQLMALLLRLT